MEFTLIETGWISILPPLMAITLALITREVYSSLFLGLFSGMLIYAFASGGSDFRVKEKPGFGGGNGAGVKIEPIGFLVVKEGNVRMVSITPPASNTIDRVIEKAPELMDTVESFLKKRTPEEKE